MMLYQNRVFVATPEVYDLNEQGGFGEVVSETPTVPRVFVPTGTKIYNEPVTRMGVLGIYTAQKALHHWFTTDRTIEVTEADWLEAIPPIPDTKLNIATFLIFETANRTYAVILGHNQSAQEVVAGYTGLESSGDEVAEVMYTMRIFEVAHPNVTFSDSTIVVGNSFTTFTLEESMYQLPITVGSQMLLNMLDLVGKRTLIKWEVTDTDVTGVNEIPITPCTPAQIDGYAKLLNTPAPRDKKLFS